MNGKLALPLSTPLPRAHASINVQGFVNALQQGFQGEIRLDRLSRALYSTDASVYQIVPAGVLLPRCDADIVHAVKTCAALGVPMTARGGGTSQAGQAIGAGVVLDCSKYLDKILEINAGEKWARVQPGVVLDDLNRAVKVHGLHFAPDISTSNRATLGGMIANNSSGTHSLIHGKTIDHVLEIRAVLADGSILHAKPLNEGELTAKLKQQDLEGACYRAVQRLAIAHSAEIERRFPKILRRVGGYNLDCFAACTQAACGPAHAPFNLANMLVGSEGTLAVTLEARVRLLNLPKAKAVLVIQFADLLDALAATPAILGHGPSAVEVIDRYVLDSTKLNPEASRLRSFLQGDPDAILIVEFYGDRAEDLPPRLEKLEDDLRQRGFGAHYHRAADAPGQGRIWKLRKLSLGLSMAEKGDAKAISFVEDTAVTPEKLRDYIGEFLDIVKSHGTKAGVYAHASVGCLHVRPVVNLKTIEGVRQFESIAAAIADLVLKYGGALSGEHGDGLVRSPFQEKMFGPTLYQAFREIKKTFDPGNILNPGKIVDAPPLASQLRLGPGYVTPEVATTFDFSVDGGAVRSAELCAGVGECRKKRDGTMCPSYQATCEELHSTRGRANTLRLAMTGQLGLHGLTDPAVKEALDLCLECKACKSECPTNVDMARLKAEFLHQYHQRHGVPWRNWIFGNVATFSRWRLLYWLSRTSVVRWLNEKLLGIDRRRLPPPLSNEVPWEVRWLRDPSFQLGGDQAKEAETLQRLRSLTGAVLFNDTFLKHYDPSLGHAIARLGLAADVCVLPGMATGWKPPGYIASCYDKAIPFDLHCCGRPMISNGMLDRAVRLAQHNVTRLFPWAASGRPIIGCEPSCILTIKDDYPALLRGDERKKAEVVAAACRTFEEHLEQTLASAARPVAFKPGPKKILVQAHCHQRSLVGVEPLMRLLRRIPGAEVIDLDAGCCGMAGSFGYEKEHYEISRLVGEQRLFPALRKADPDTVIVAPGFSCRIQIEHFTGRKAIHPAQLLHQLLEPI